ncbi:hypothetical protein SEA_AOKA_53 [Arthrobacter phage Aoka]|nr:hypothetical protein SEA_AOKA_53 [Arthrobacter phage Aoka]
MIPVELVGGPADGTLLQVQDPPPRYLQLAAASLPARDPAPDPDAVVEVRMILYLDRETWNPKTRCRQYVLC